MTSSHQEKRVDALFALLERQGSGSDYIGESISQLEHFLQVRRMLSCLRRNQVNQCPTRTRLLILRKRTARMKRPSSQRFFMMWDKFSQSRQLAASSIRSQARAWGGRGMTPSGKHT